MSRAIAAFRLIKWRKLRIQRAYCPLCARRRLMARLDDNEIAVRCLSCGASAVMMSLASVLRRIEPELASKHVYELSARGAFFNWLKTLAGELTFSEYFNDTLPGDYRDGVQCQDVQRLTYPDASFDVCTATEVFEHVPDDLRGFAEIHRVLNPGGVFAFTVPLTDADETVERAKQDKNGKLQHWLPPEYHGDPIRGGQQILAFRNYGRDIICRMRAQGFNRAQIIAPPDIIPWNFARCVIVGWKDHISSA